MPALTVKHYLTVNRRSSQSCLPGSYWPCSGLTAALNAASYCTSLRMCASDITGRAGPALACAGGGRSRPCGRSALIGRRGRGGLVEGRQEGGQACSLSRTASALGVAQGSRTARSPRSRHSWMSQPRGPGNTGRPARSGCWSRSRSRTSSAVISVSALVTRITAASEACSPSVASHRRQRRRRLEWDRRRLRLPECCLGR
jgi:hypothetical protein